MKKPPFDPGIRLPVMMKRLRLHARRRTQPGDRPGTVVADPDAPPPQISVMQYNDRHFTEAKDVDIDRVRECRNPEMVTWININGLGDARTIEAIGEAFGLHRLVQEDIVNVHQRAKVEVFDDHLFIVARMVSLDDNLSTEQISIILGDNFVLTFQERIGDCLGPVRKRLREHIGRIRTAAADYLAYAILDAIIDGYFPVLDKYSEQLDHLEERLSTNRSKHVVARIHRLRSEFYILRKAIWPHRELFNTLLRDSETRFAKETHMYLRDCYDHTIQIIDIVETSREIASDIRDFHFTQVSMKQNEIMKVLTVVSSVFIPLSFVAGLYGMNFDSEISEYNMPELHWAYGYPMALSLMAAIAFGMLIFFWRRGWLNR
jgi:magnesium transporter